MVKYVPERGDIVWLEFELQKGKEITKTRPALVISPQSYNAKTSLALFMPITSQIKNYPFEVEIHTQEINGAVLSDQIRSLDWQARKAKKMTKISEKLISEVLSKLETVLE